MDEEIEGRSANGSGDASRRGRPREDRAESAQSGDVGGGLRKPSERLAHGSGDSWPGLPGAAGGPLGSFDVPGPFGSAGISLLLDLLVERTRSQAWSVERQRAHARALLQLSRDHWFTEEETAVLCAFLRT